MISCKFQIYVDEAAPVPDSAASPAAKPQDSPPSCLGPGAAAGMAPPQDALCRAGAFGKALVGKSLLSDVRLHARYLLWLLAHGAPLSGW